MKEFLKYLPTQCPSILDQLTKSIFVFPHSTPSSAGDPTFLEECSESFFVFFKKEQLY